MAVPTRNKRDTACDLTEQSVQTDHQVLDLVVLLWFLCLMVFLCVPFQVHYQPNQFRAGYKSGGEKKRWRRRGGEEGVERMGGEEGVEKEKRMNKGGWGGEVGKRQFSLAL